MDLQDTYRPPQSRLEAPPSDVGEPAGRLQRLAAALLDGLLMLAITMPIMIVSGYMEQVMGAAARGQSIPFATTLFWSVVGFLLFLAVQGYPLAKSGQTWGKKALGLGIVDLTGGLVPIGTLVMKRYLPLHVVLLVPVVGNLAHFVNALLIFRADRRCGHDLLAGTRVVKLG